MAAGLGFKTFTTGEVLTAADTNGYLMQGVLVFASAAARDAAITSPQEGQCCYLKDTDAVLTYSGAAWVGFDDSNAIQNTIVDAKGDIVAASASDTPARLAVGTNTAVLTADSTQGTGLAWDGVWTTFTPSFTGVTVGNGTLIARYRKVGKTVDVYVKLTLGSTSSLNASLNYFALPFNLAYGSDGLTVKGGLNDASPVTLINAASEFNGNNVILATLNTSGTYGTNSRITATLPFTWTTSDFFWYQVRYEAA